MHTMGPCLGRLEHGAPVVLFRVPLGFCIQQCRHSLFTDGLANPAVGQHYAMHWTVTVLVFFGALGMVAIFDLFDPSRLRERMNQPWKHIGFATKIALYFSVGLVAFGAAAYWALEYDGTLKGMSTFG